MSNPSPTKIDPNDPWLARQADKVLAGTSHFVDGYMKESGKRYTKAVEKDHAVSGSKMVKSLNDQFNVALLASILVAGPLGPLAFFLLKEAALGAADASVAIAKQAGKDAAMLAFTGLFAGTIWAGKKVVQADARLGEWNLHHEFESIAKNIKTARGEGFLFDLNDMRSSLNVMATNLGLPPGSKLFVDSMQRVHYEHKDPSTGQYQSLHGRPSMVVISETGDAVAQIWHDNGIVQKAVRATDDGRIEVKLFDHGNFSPSRSSGFIAEGKPAEIASLISQGAVSNSSLVPRNVTMGVETIREQALLMRVCIEQELEKAVARGDQSAVERLREADLHITTICTHASAMEKTNPTMTITVETTGRVDLASLEVLSKQMVEVASLKKDAEHTQPSPSHNR